MKVRFASAQWKDIIKSTCFDKEDKTIGESAIKITYIILESLIPTMVFITANHHKNHQNDNAIFADPESPRPVAANDDDRDDASLSSNSSSSSSKSFVEDSTSNATTALSNSKRSNSMATTNWFDDNLGTARSSSLVIFLIVAFAVIVGSLMYTVGKNQEESKFQNKFDDVSGEMIQVIEERTQSFTTSIHRVGLGITAIAVASNKGGQTDWPFHTTEDLGLFAQDILDRDPRILLTYAPLVSQEHRLGWEIYSVANQGLVTTDFIPEDPHVPIPPRRNISSSIYRQTRKHQVPERPNAMGPFSPAWQVIPFPFGENTSVVNLNLLSKNIFARLAEVTLLTRASAASELETPQELLGIPINPDPVYKTGPKEDPQRLLVQPIFGDVKEDASIVGHLAVTQPWQSVFKDIVDESCADVELHLVASDSCTKRSYTYWIQGNHTEYVGPGDLHESQFDNLERTSVLASYELDLPDAANDTSHCRAALSIYPTARMQAKFDSNNAIGYLLLVFFLAVILIMAFATHNKAVNQREHLLQLKTQRSNAIVASLFPEQIRSKMFGDDGALKEDLHLVNAGAQQNLGSLLKKGGGGMGMLGFDDDSFEEKQVADLYPAATVMFADICGFTAWSSTRDPAQVFNLLENVFRSFDDIGKRRRVFKVETIGDCYLAVCGLPDPRRDHAIVMARYSRDVLEKFHLVTRMLEVTLGPDTADLGLRIGLHSGPITAGVLRGEKGRFQLFGDTVNTGSRLETTGLRNRIHISKETADLIQEGGKGNWLRARGEVVQAKGKGTLATFWLLPKSATLSSTASHSTGSNIGSSGLSTEGRHTVASERLDAGMHVSRKDHSEAKLERLIFWVSEALLQSLRQVVAQRNASSKAAHKGGSHESVRALEHEMSKHKVVLDEVREMIALPKYDAEAVAKQVDPKTIDLGHEVETQLREFVTLIASLYQANPFHNFHHASHVAMSIMKLMSRIVAPDKVLQNRDCERIGDVAETLHDYTYGITSCPLTQFAVLLAAVVHDVDHRGVSNVDLCNENPILAKIFDGKSVAEQNSIGLAWETLMDPSFQDLRDCIYTDSTELRRFRQLIVNCVMATDIFDKELSALRKKRWDRAFEVADKDATQEDIHRKATIVIEHLIQASDVSHTMQHWQVYLKWNEHFFEEQYTSFLQGRSNGKDPSKSWYKGELWFFDNYIIPLAKKLKDCGVFGVSSDECLSYALMNREEWEMKGEEVVSRFVQKYSKQLDKHEASEGGEAPSVATTAPSCVSDPFHHSDRRNCIRKSLPPTVAVSAVC